MADLRRLAKVAPVAEWHLKAWEDGLFVSLERALVSLACHLLAEVSTRTKAETERLERIPGSITIAPYMGEKANQEMVRKILEKFQTGEVLTLPNVVEIRNDRHPVELERLANVAKKRTERDEQAMKLLRDLFPSCPPAWFLKSPNGAASGCYCTHPRLDDRMGEMAEIGKLRINAWTVALGPYDMLDGSLTLFAGQCGYEGCGCVYYTVRERQPASIFIGGSVSPPVKIEHRNNVEVMPEIP